MRNICSAFTLIIVLGLAACGEKGNITGNISNAEGQMVVLEHLSFDKVNALDSIAVAASGDFSMNVPITTTGYHRLRVDKDNSIILILEPEDKVSINGNAFDFYASYTVEGSAQSVELKKLDTYLRGAFEVQDSLTKVFRSFQGQGHPRLDSIGKVLDANFQEMNKSKRQFLVDFINDNEGKLVSLSAIEALSPEDDFDLYLRVGEAWGKTMPESEYVIGFQKRIDQIKAKAEAGKASEIGAMAPELAMSTPDGAPIKLSDFRGKYVLVDFWAAWCKPCRAENPHVLKVYNKYKNKNFDIFGVSLDRTKDAWVSAIAADGLPWKHGSELQFWNSSFVPVYGLKGIPMTVLVDPDGKIVAKGLRAAQLEAKLKELLG
jgi:thiol-disulfide isomerase/thioredoxin